MKACFDNISFPIFQTVFLAAAVCGQPQSTNNNKCLFIGQLVQTSHSVQGDLCAKSINDDVITVENFSYDGTGFGVFINIGKLRNLDSFPLCRQKLRNSRNFFWKKHRENESKI